MPTGCVFVLKQTLQHGAQHWAHAPNCCRRCRVYWRAKLFSTPPAAHAGYTSSKQKESKQMSDIDDDGTGGTPAHEEKKPALKHTVRELADSKPLTVKRGAFARAAFKKALGTDTEPTDLCKVADAHQAKISEWSGFMGEMHAALYDPYGTKKLGEGEIDPVGAELLGTAESQAAWGELKAAARCHSVIAAEAVKDLATAVAAATGIDQMHDDEESSKTPEELQQEQENIQGMDVPEDDAQAQADKQEALNSIKTAQVKSAARRTALQQKLDAARKNGTLARAVNKVAKAASQQADAVNALRACGVGTGAGSPADGDETATGAGKGAGGGNKDPITMTLIKQAMAMQDFAKIVEMVGRMQQAADMKAEEALSVGRLAPTGIHQSREMTDLLASEWALDSDDPADPAHQNMQDMWLKRYLDGEMLAVERESPEPKHKGDLLIFVDRSGSMQGERIQWARALAMAAIQRATKDKRRWIVTMYADSYNSLRSSSSLLGFQHALNTLSVNAGGGTATDWAIRTVITKTDLGLLRDPDILLVTDGEWEDLSPETQQVMAGLKTRLFVVQLEGALRHIEGANRVWRVEDLNIDKAATVLSEVTL